MRGEDLRHLSNGLRKGGVSLITGEVSHAMTENDNDEIEQLIQARRVVDRDLPAREKRSAPALSVLRMLDVDEVYNKKHFRYDAAAEEILFHSEVVTPTRVSAIGLDLAERYHFGDVAERTAERALLKVAQEQTFNPITDYLTRVKWDGVARVKALPKVALGCELPIAERYMEAWMLGACARAFEPGYKMDMMLVLQGRQSVGKSTFFHILGTAMGTDKYFSSSRVDLTTKDGQQSLAGRWMLEFAELDGVYKPWNAAKLKNFITDPVDTYRPSYGRSTQKFPRKCIFGASVNPKRFLCDETGSRRFGVIPVEKQINTAYLKTNRDQLWAEAMVMYENSLKVRRKSEFDHHAGFMNQEELEVQEVTNTRFATITVLERSLEEYLSQREEITATELTQRFARADEKEYKRLTVKLKELGFVQDGREQSSRAWVRNVEKPQ